MRARKCDRCGAFYECDEYSDGIAVDSEKHQYRHTEFDVVKVALPAARIVSDGHEACAAGVPHGEAGARQYGAHYRQADARERPSEERPDTEND